MTQKAHALGMSRTTYVNASGLPDDDQITTARDQALLGRAIEDRFPHYYAISPRHPSPITATRCAITTTCSAPSAASTASRPDIREASGFNLVTSVHRDGRYIVAVVLGGHPRRPARRAHARTDQRSHQGGRAASQRTGHRRESGAAQGGEAPWRPSSAPR